MKKVRIVLELEPYEHLALRSIAYHASDDPRPEVAQVAARFLRVLEGTERPSRSAPSPASSSRAAPSGRTQRPRATAAARPASGSRAPRSPAELREALATSARLDPAKAIILQAVLEVRPDARLQPLVSIADVRRRAGLPKGTFDRAVIALAAEDAITLHQHDHPAGLSPAERAALVEDERGNHYIGLVWSPAADRYLRP